ncbi:MAG: hypothetical protein A2X48_17610 [Lentisphaerae bacterium GWF2_49_21]|nr:MAG: hypothetical protein A2X48_17610 [Lentisphaerae bacterium GWF2_49_21]
MMAITTSNSINVNKEEDTRRPELVERATRSSIRVNPDERFALRATPWQASNSIKVNLAELYFFIINIMPQAEYL